MPATRISSGDLRQRIGIQASSEVQDGSGQPGLQWTTIATVWASLMAITGKDVYALGAGFTEQVSHKVVIRYQAQLLTSNLRVIYESQVFLVLASFDPDGRKEQIQLVCQVQDK